MSKEILSASEHINHEYCATVVRIGEVKPIEGSDFLGQTLVNGLSIVVRKDFVKEGDIMFYAANETALNLEFLSVTNQFELSHRELNKNYKEVERRLNLVAQLRSEDKFDEANDLELETKQMVGFFNQHGRVKMIRLRGCPSMGYLFDIDSMSMFCPEIKDVNLEEWIDKDFDTVNGELFIKVYLPPVKSGTPRNPDKRANKRNKKLSRFDRMIPGEFAFHYDTQQLNRSMFRVNPDTIVTISNKLHGTSFIAGKIKVKQPKWNGLYAKIFNYLPNFLKFTIEVYDNVYSSRTVIKNQYINTFAKNGGYYETDIWGEYNNLIKDYIPEGMTIYGEIVGYMTGSQSMIQKGYDYGCAEGTNQLMPYRITTKQEDGTLLEWEVQDVYDWTVQFMNDHPEIANRIRPIQIFYHGTLSELYPDVNVTIQWHENILELMKNDIKNFGMEKNEPLCKNKVPREGIVLRIDHDPMKEAFKLKCIKFLKHEADEIDAGTYEDMEATERYDQ